MYSLDDVNSNNNKEGKTLKTPKQYNDNLKNKSITEEIPNFYKKMKEFLAKQKPSRLDWYLK